MQTTTKTRPYKIASDENDEQFVSGPAANHNGVTIRIGAPLRTVSVPKPRRVYPVALSAEHLVAQVTKQALEASRGVVEGASGSEIGDVSTANRPARWWDL